MTMDKKARIAEQIDKLFSYRYQKQVAMHKVFQGLVHSNRQDPEQLMHRMYNCDEMHAYARWSVMYMSLLMRKQLMDPRFSFI